MTTLRFHAGFKVLCSVQHHSRRHAPRPISVRHASSRLASSLLRQPMQTLQGEALMELANQGLPPDLVSLAASLQLKHLAATSTPVTNVEADLHRRIMEVKEKERRKALQEIVFALVASKLLHAMLALPDLHSEASSAEHARLQDDTMQAMQTPRRRLDDVLKAIHAPEAQPLASRHVAMVINGVDRADDPVQPYEFAHVCKWELGKMYAASVMYGYFLARVHRRLKLEQTLQPSLETVPMEAYCYGFRRSKSEGAIPTEGQCGFQDEGAIRRMSRLSCPLTLSLIERHCETMFGRVPCHTNRNSLHADSTMVHIQLGFVRTLMYQALAFGALLWDMQHNFVPLFYPHICQHDC